MALTKVTYSMIDGIETITTPNSDPISYVARVTNYTGGTPGFVTSASRVRTITNATNTNFEWAFLSVLDNYADAGENVAIYAQANKRGAGPTWAGVLEVKDRNPSSATASAGLIGLELDVFANGTDANNNRIGIDIVAGRTDPLDTTCRITWGLRMLAQANNPANATYQGGILLNATMLTGIQIAGVINKGIYFTSTKSIGIDFADGIFSSAAIRFAANQEITLEPTNALAMQTPNNTDLRLKFTNNNVEYVGIKIGSSNPGLYVNTIKVVGEQQAAIPNSADATVNSILAALRTHGLIAT